MDEIAGQLEIVFSRLIKLEVKLDAVLSWIQDEYGEDHKIFQTLHSKGKSKSVNPQCSTRKPDNLKGKQRGTSKQRKLIQLPDKSAILMNPLVLHRSDSFRCSSRLSQDVNLTSTSTDNEGQTHEIDISGITDEVEDGGEGIYTSADDHDSSFSIPHSQFIIPKIELPGLSNTNTTEEEDERDPLELFSSEQGDKEKSSFISEGDERRHRQTLVTGESATATKKYSCEICEKQFGRVGNLQNHNRIVHKMSEPYVCLVCGKGFTVKSEWNKHLRVETQRRIRSNNKSIAKGPPKTCEICNKVFASRSSLYSHTKVVHETVKAHMCSFCGKSYVSKSELNDHMDTHSDVHNHKCPYCDKTFKLRRSMTMHRARHLGNAKKQCTLCGKILVNIVSLQKHIQVVHEGVRRYPCSICDKKFATWSARNYHQKTHSNPNTKYRGLNKVVGPRLKKNDPAGKHLIRQVEPDEIKKARKGGSHYVPPVIHVSIPKSDENDQKC